MSLDFNTVFREASVAAGKITFDRDMIAEIASLVARSVMDERERCAKVAEADTSFMMLQDFGMQTVATQVRTNIADEIRKG